MASQAYLDSVKESLLMFHIRMEFTVCGQRIFLVPSRLAKYQAITFMAHTHSTCLRLLHPFGLESSPTWLMLRTGTLRTTHTRVT